MVNDDKIVRNAYLWGENMSFKRDRMFYKFSMYGFLKNLRFFDPFMILFLREMGLSFFEIGSLYAIRDLSTNFLEIPTGVYADMFGRRKSMIMAFISYIASFFIFYFFTSYFFYVFAMVLFAFGEAFRSGTHKALILEYLRLNDMEDVKVEYYGHTRSASQLGSAVSSLIAAGLVFYSGSYRYIFLASIVPYVLDLVNLATYPKELDGEIKKIKSGDWKAHARSTLKEFLFVFKNIKALKVLFNSASFSAFFKVSKEYLQPILKMFALSLPIFVSMDAMKRTSIIVGLVYFFIYLMTSWASRHSHELSKKFRNLPSAVNITYFVGAVLILLTGIALKTDLQILSILSLLILYVLQNFRRPMNVSLVSDRISHKTMASGLSVESQITTILMAIFAPLLGIAVDVWGIDWALTLFGLFMLLVGIVVKV